MEKRIELPLSADVIESLRAGDKVKLCGELLVMRDAAHKRLFDAICSGESLPVDVNGQVVYYMGPSPAREGKVIGSAGPTTSARMDAYTPALLKRGLRGMIGKGKRSPEVIRAMMENGAVYFAAIGGCGALLSKSVTESKVICYGDLGTEAVRRITVCDFPLIVAIDCKGNNLYEKSI